MPEKGKSDGNILRYFQKFFKEASVAQKIALVSYFLIFFLTPLYGLPEIEEGVKTTSAMLLIIFIVVQIASILALILFNRKIGAGYRRVGNFTLAVITLPLVLLLVSSAVSGLLNPTPFWAVRAMTSVAMAVPMILIILVLIESIIFMGRWPSVSRLPISLALVAIFFIIYTFATFYFINDLLVRIDGKALSFADALYSSGLAFTSLGFVDAFPTGVGKVLAVFESIMGYITIALITTILIQLVLRQGKEV